MVTIQAVQDVSAAHLGVLIGTNAVQVIDTRGTEFFISRIPGSVHTPAHEFSKLSKDLVVECRNSGKLLVLVHKDSGDLVASLAAKLLEQMLERNAQNMCSVGVLNGGFQAWEKKYATHPLSAKFITREFIQIPVLPKHWEHRGSDTNMPHTTSELPTLRLEDQLRQQPVPNNQIRANGYSIASARTIGELPLVGLYEEDSCQAKSHVKIIQHKSRLDMRTTAMALPTISGSTTCERLYEEEVGDQMPRSRFGEVLTCGSRCTPIVNADPLVSEYSSSGSESRTNDEADY